MESLLLHAKLLPGERDGLFPHARLLLHSGARDLPRSPAALRPVAGRLGDHAAHSRHGAGLSRRPQSDGGGGGGAPEEREARGKPTVSGERGVEAVAAAVPLHPRPALSVGAQPTTSQTPGWWQPGSRGSSALGITSCCSSKRQNERSAPFGISGTAFRASTP